MSTEGEAAKASFAKDLDATMEGQESSGKVYKLDEVIKHSTAEDLWLAIHNKVYNISKFVDEHPGGIEVLLENAGTDATYAFEDVGHSLDARDLLGQYYIGDLHEDDQVQKAATATDSNEGGVGSSTLLVGVAVALLAAGAFFMFNRT